MAKREQPSLFSVAAWASLDDAFAGAKAALGSSALALLDLRGHLLSGRLPSGVRRIERDDTEVFEELEPSFWEVRTLQEGFGPGPDGHLRRSGTVKVHDRGALYSHARRWYFVSRRHLDKLYTVTAPVGEVGRPPALTAEQIAALKQEYRTQNGKPKMTQHLQRFAETKFKIVVHKDTIRDWVIKPVKLEK